MFDAFSVTELDAQHVELLPARTVLSLMLTSHGGGGGGHGLGNGGGGGAGGNGGGAISVNAGNLNNVGNVALFGSQITGGNQNNIPVAIGGNGGAGGGGGAGFNVCAIALCRGH
jgi:hypothetical protein